MQNNDSPLDASRNGVSGAAGATELSRLQAQVDQLEQALESRIIIEQAKGAVSARCDVPTDVAFEMIRGTARSQRRKLSELCAEIVANGGRFAVAPRTTRRPSGPGLNGSH
jgi:hypothetical protein